MIRTIRQYFEARIVYREEAPVPRERALQLATAALLIEVSRADFDRGPEEREAIEEALQKSFGLERAETRELVDLAEAEVERSISLYEFSRLVDQSFSPEQKQHVIGLLWDVAFSDDRLEEREEYLIRKVATLLHVPHSAFIAEKLAARERRKAMG
jgi:uncharacterized tellurite resistance protein B-like protein